MVLEKKRCKKTMVFKPSPLFFAKLPLPFTLNFESKKKARQRPGIRRLLCLSCLILFLFSFRFKTTFFHCHSESELAARRRCFGFSLFLPQVLIFIVVDGCDRISCSAVDGSTDRPPATSDQRKCLGRCLAIPSKMAAITDHQPLSVLADPHGTFF